VNKNSSSAIMDAVDDTLELTQKQLNKEIDHSTDDFDIAVRPTHTFRAQDTSYTRGGFRTPRQGPEDWRMPYPI
jgi:hypothetical protein